VLLAEEDEQLPLPGRLGGEVYREREGGGEDGLALAVDAGGLAGEQHDARLGGRNLKGPGGRLLLDFEFHLLGPRQRAEAGLVRLLVLGRVQPHVVQRDRLDFLQRVDQPDLDGDLGGAVLDLAVGDSAGADPAVQHPCQVGGRDGQADAAAADDGHGDADQPPVRVHHRAAAVARVQVAVDLHRRHLAVLPLADAGDGPRADRDGRVPSAGQALAEGEAEDEHLHGLHRFGRLVEVDWPGQVRGARHAQDGEVLVGVGGETSARTDRSFRVPLPKTSVISGPAPAPAFGGTAMT
jgi:hypothetical protein